MRLERAVLLPLLLLLQGSQAVSKDIASTRARTRTRTRTRFLTSDMQQYTDSAQPTIPCKPGAGLPIIESKSKSKEAS